MIAQGCYRCKYFSFIATELSPGVMEDVPICTEHLKFIYPCKGFDGIVYQPPKMTIKRWVHLALRKVSDAIKKLPKLYWHIRWELFKCRSEKSQKRIWAKMMQKYWEGRKKEETV